MKDSVFPMQQVVTHTPQLVASRRVVPALLGLLGTGASAAAIGADLVGAGGQWGFGVRQAGLLAAGLLLLLTGAVLASPMARRYVVGQQHIVARRLVVAGACALIAVYGLAAYWRAQGPGNATYFWDEGVYTYVGWAWSQGFWPYLDSWDHKGPTVYLTTLARSAVAGNGAQALRVQEVVFAVATALLVAGIANVLWGGHSAALAFALAILMLTQRPPSLGHVSTVGSLIALFTAGAILASLGAARTTAFRGAALLAAVAGISSGLAVSTKPSAVVGFVVGAAVLYWLGQHTLRNRLLLVAIAAASTLVPVGVLAALFGHAGALDALVDVYIRFNSGWGYLLLEGRGALHFVLELPQVLSFLGVWRLFLGAVAATTLLLLWQQARHSSGSVMHRAAPFVGLLWLAGETAALVSNGTRQYQAQPVLIALALVATAVIMSARHCHAGLGRIGGAAAFLFVAVPLLHATASYAPPPTDPWPDWDGAASVLAAATSAEDTVLNLGNPLPLALANRRSASPYVIGAPMLIKGYASNERWQQFVEVLEGDKPPKAVMIVIPPLKPPGGEPTLEWVLRAYDPQRGGAFDRLFDWTEYPARLQFKQVAANHYRLGECSGGVCFLHRRDEPGPSHGAQDKPTAGLAPREGGIIGGGLVVSGRPREPVFEISL